MKQSVFNVLPNIIRMCEKGYVMAVVEYRHTGLVGFPAQAPESPEGRLIGLFVRKPENSNTIVFREKV